MHRNRNSKSGKAITTVLNSLRATVPWIKYSERERANENHMHLLVSMSKNGRRNQSMKFEQTTETTITDKRTCVWLSICVCASECSRMSTKSRGQQQRKREAKRETERERETVARPVYLLRERICAGAWQGNTGNRWREAACKVQESM